MHQRSWTICSEFFSNKWLADIRNGNSPNKSNSLRTIRSVVVILGWLAVVFSLPMPNALGQVQQFGETTQLFPQFAAGNGWTTYITFHNPTLEPQLVTLQLFRSDGSTLLNRVLPLGPSATQTFSTEPAAELTVGWAKLSSNGRFSGALLFQFSEQLPFRTSSFWARSIQGK